MRRWPVLLLSALLAAACLLAQAEPARAAKKARTAKDLLLAELTAIQKDVAADRWVAAQARLVKLGVYWAQYRATHPGLKKGLAERFARSHRNLQAHLRERSKIKIYFDLGVLRAIVLVLKA